MTSKKELQLAYGLAIIMLVVGVASYSAFPAKKPDTPVRVMFSSLGGNVLFDHKTHTSESGYGVSCRDCHHHPAGDDSANRACGDCHGEPEKVKAVCAECHDANEVDPGAVMKRSDAFHKQCAGCHEDKGSGPAGKDCALCHVKP